VGEHPPLVGIELVQPRAEGALERDRQLVGGAARELDDEQRIPSGALDQTIRRTGVQRERPGLVAVQALELDEKAVAARTDAGRLPRIRGVRSRSPGPERPRC